MRTLSLVPILLCLVTGCSESTDGPKLVGPDADFQVPADTTDAPEDAAPSFAKATMVSTVVLNEVHATGDEWVEIINTGEIAVDLGGWGVTDENDDGTPREKRAARFPEGFILGAQAYALVLANQDAPADGVIDQCGGLPVQGCLTADWGISADKGERIFLLNASDEVVDSTAYAAKAGSWGRIPDGHGDFADGDPSPDAPNRAP